MSRFTQHQRTAYSVQRSVEAAKLLYANRYTLDATKRPEGA